MDDEAASRYYEALIGEYVGAEPSAAVDEIVFRFVEPIRAAFVTRQGDESAMEELLWPAWHAIIAAARATSGPSQDRLVELLIGIKRQGVLTRLEKGRKRECTVWGNRVFVDLPVFGAEMREMVDGGPVDAWVNGNAFAARLTAAGVDFSLYAIWTLRDCLEERSPLNFADLRAVVPWFQHCGRLLAHLAIREASFDHADQRPAELGELCTDRGMTRGGFTAQRWRFWHERLADLAAGSDATADVAREALQWMPRLNGPEPAPGS
ncbi:DUF3632 domain-containing protein [Streptomyces sp. enrichment culture]|uniref:DUF3632 domain-containing protein n=1 Tax=Streptomyces sp. enrichment culture TaxID=1795815 RepID=UPI003F5504D2